ncbi:hypothetical protein GBAR_LOCUS13888 [Geodia barretti]|uniref:Uncharacterized protein n=1 Tax=Geodia barretti TaxID=519541 RepID=A0AA35S7S2_GEOBA|nr:hypothetical protein GBAR_LOCUS13888 [Geodia barretti]
MATPRSITPQSSRRLTLVFDLNRMGGQSIFGGKVVNVPDLFVDRGTTPEIRPIASHLKEHLGLRDHASYFLLLEAVCAPRGFPNSAPSSSISRPDRPYVIPLVCDQVRAILQQCQTTNPHTLRKSFISEIMCMGTNCIAGH